MLETVFDINMDSRHHYITFVTAYILLLCYYKAPKKKVTNFA